MQKFLPDNYSALNNGILLKTAEYGSKQFHFDAAHIAELNNVLGYDSHPQNHLGVITGLQSQIGLDIVGGGSSLWSLSTNGMRNVKVITGDQMGRYTWDTYLPTDYKAKILAYESVDREKPGRDNSPIRLKISKRIGSHGAIFTFSKLAGVELRVGDEPITGSEAEGFWYTVYHITNNNKNSWVDPRYLQEGIYVCATGSVIGERGELYDDRGVSAAKRTYYNYVGNAMAQKYFTVTRHAALSTIPTDTPAQIGLDMHKRIVEIHLMSSKSAAFNANKVEGADLLDFTQKYYGKGAQGAKNLAKDIVHTVLVPEIELYYMALINQEIEHYAIWGNGGTIRTSSKDPQATFMPVGLFRQIMKSANRYSFNINNFKLDQLVAFLNAGMRGKTGVSSRKVVRVKTGTGGLSLVKPQILAKFNQVSTNTTLFANEFIYNKGGDNLNLGFRMEFDRITLPMGTMEIIFEHAPELDANMGDYNDIDNPIVGKVGYRLSSYSFIIDDITGEGNNIIELYNEVNKDFHLFHVDGKMPYLGDKNRHAASSVSNPGYEVYIEKGYKAYQVVDPAKVYMMLPINPRTRQMFGTYMSDAN